MVSGNAENAYEKADEMMDNVKFRGIYPALVTPLEDNGSVRQSAVAPLIRFMLDQGVDGFYVLGGTGEGAALAERERMRMAEATADAMRGTGKKLILHVGAADTQAAIRLARHAASVGADAISSVYPNFFCTYGTQEAADYYRALVDASGLPMLCYCTSMIHDQDPLGLVEKLMEIDGVIGVKYTFPNYFTLQKIKQLHDGNINVINGPDETLLCGLCMGADGGIGASYNLVPGKFVALYRHFMAKDLQGAILEQQKINRVIQAVQHFPLIPAVKYALELIGFPVGYAAYPGKRMTEDEKLLFRKLLTDAGMTLE